jgi:thiol-disulfide isomerase/thioredoxin
LNNSQPTTSNKSSNIQTIITIVAVLSILISALYYTNSQQTPSNNNSPETGESKESDEAMMHGNEDVMTEEHDMMMQHPSLLLAGNTAPLLDFTKEAYETALQSDKLVVLYFYANWCPECKKEFPVVQSVFNNLSTGQVIGFRVNYNDDQTDTDEQNLAREFGVAYQHTKVFVKNQKRILKSPEGWDVERYKTEINKALTQ